MKQTWQNSDNKEIIGRVDAHIIPFVEALGLDCAVTFLVNFGGSVVFFSTKPNPNNQIARIIGIEATQALYDKFDNIGAYRIPTAKKFLARYFRSCEISVNEISRMLHVTGPTVRSYLLSDQQIRERAERKFDQLQQEAIQ